MTTEPEPRRPPVVSTPESRAEEQAAGDAMRAKYHFNQDIPRERYLGDDAAKRLYGDEYDEPEPDPEDADEEAEGQ